jgi:uncharacterized phage-associated protein
MAPYDARAVANALLDLGDRYGSALTQMSLLKMLYFAHGWYLASFDQPLVVQNFEAWEYVPVIKVVRDSFSEFKDRRIDRRAYRFNLLKGNLEPLSERLSERDTDFVKNIFLQYRVYTAWELSDMTHEKGSPWDEIWNAPLPIGRIGLRLRNEDIKCYFARLPGRLSLS